MSTEHCTLTLTVGHIEYNHPGEFVVYNKRVSKATRKELHDWLDIYLQRHNDSLQLELPLEKE